MQNDSNGRFANQTGESLRPEERRSGIRATLRMLTKPASRGLESEHRDAEAQAEPGSPNDNLSPFVSKAEFTFVTEPM